MSLFGKKGKHREEPVPKPKKEPNGKHRGKKNPFARAKGAKKPKQSKAAKKRQQEYDRAWGREE